MIYKEHTKHKKERENERKRRDWPTLRSSRHWEREREPCPSLSGTDWLLLIPSASLSTPSVAGRKRERDVKGMNDMIYDSTPYCPEGYSVCNTSTENMHVMQNTWLHVTRPSFISNNNSLQQLFWKIHEPAQLIAFTTLYTLFGGMFKQDSYSSIKHCILYLHIVVPHVKKEDWFNAQTKTKTCCPAWKEWNYNLQLEKAKMLIVAGNGCVLRKFDATIEKH